jgi:hypothetical protein
VSLLKVKRRPSSPSGPVARYAIVGDDQLQDRDALDLEARRLANRAVSDVIDARRDYAVWAKWAAAVQLAVADIGFMFYGFFNRWHIPSVAIEYWLAATIVEVIGVVVLIVKAIFSELPPGAAE